MQVNFDQSAVLSRAAGQSILAPDDALTGLSPLTPRQTKMVKVRYFGGLTEEIEAVRDISPRTIRRDSDLANPWLRYEPSRSAVGLSGQLA